MKTLLLIFACFSLAACISAGTTSEQIVSEQNVLEQGVSTKLKVLIVDGQNNHGDWPKTTFMMKQYLEETELFEVDIYRTVYTWRGKKLVQEFPLLDGKEYKDLENPKPDPNFIPNFKDYQLVISNFGWKASSWPQKTKKAFEDYFSEGGGLVTVHAANNSFPKWKAYNKMIGLGGWGDRTYKDGPLVYYDNNDNLVRDSSKGWAGDHGKQHEFQVKTRDSSHPIMRGLPEVWLHLHDELYCKLRGPAENMTVLATAFDKEKTQRHEPVLMAIDYGQGRIFHSTLGHGAYAFESVGFITTFLRGAEWAATGKVTMAIPQDFPKADKTSRRKFVWNQQQ